MKSYFLNMYFKTCDFSLQHAFLLSSVLWLSCSVSVQLFMSCLCGFSGPLGIKSHCLLFCCFSQRVSDFLSHELKLVFHFLNIFIIYFCILFWQKSPETWQTRLVLSHDQFPVYFPNWRISMFSEWKSLLLSQYEKKTIRIFVQFSFFQKLCYWLCGWGHKSLSQRFTPQFLHSGRVSLLDTNKCSKVVLSINSYFQSGQQQQKQKQAKTEF